jgi:hypothetical protein
VSRNRGPLYVVDVMGNVDAVPNTYEGIKAALDGATLDFRSFGEVGFYCDDEGMLTQLALNVPASFMFGMVLYGPIVLCSGEADADGDTLPPPDRAVRGLIELAEQWQRVVEDAGRKGQDITVRADAATIPPPTIVGFGPEEFDRFLETGEMPDGS